MVATDVLWSDPVAEAGLRINHSRGVGLVFGPEITQVPLPPLLFTHLFHVRQAARLSMHIISA